MKTSAYGTEIAICTAKASTCSKYSGLDSCGVGTVVLFPIGLWAYRRADRRIRRLGTINQY